MTMQRIKPTIEAAPTFRNEAGVVHVVGALNRESVPNAWHERDTWALGSGELIMNLSQVNAVDSAGLAMLIQLKAELQTQQRELTLQNVNKQLVAFAAVSGVTELLSLS